MIRDPFYKKIIELNKEMYSASSSLTATHPFSSYFYQWPFMKKPIWYWSEKDNWASGNIYLFGNLVIWLFVLFSVAAGIILFFSEKFSRIVSPFLNMFLFGFFLNLLPYFFVKRVTFLYHYLPSLIFGILIFVLLWEKIPSFYRFKIPQKAYYGIFGIILLFFLAFTPITYGFLIPEKISSYYQKIIGIIN